MLNFEKVHTNELKKLLNDEWLIMINDRSYAKFRNVIFITKNNIKKALVVEEERNLNCVKVNNIHISIYNIDQNDYIENKEKHLITIYEYTTNDSKKIFFDQNEIEKIIEKFNHRRKNFLKNNGTTNKFMIDNPNIYGFKSKKNVMIRSDEYNYLVSYEGKTKVIRKK